MEPQQPLRSLLVNFENRLQIPMTLICNACQESILENAVFPLCREPVTGEMFQGNQIFRYYINCTRCNRKITIKEVYEDSPHADGCLVESGATRLSHITQLAGNPLCKKKPRDKRGPRFHIVNDTLVLKEEMKKPLNDGGMAEGDHETVQDGSKKTIKEDEIKQ